MRTAAQEQRARASGMGRWGRLKVFFRDSWLELQKVIWPTEEEVVKMTGLVLAVVTIIGGFIYLWDRVLVVFTRPLFQ